MFGADATRLDDLRRGPLPPHHDRAPSGTGLGPDAPQACSPRSPCSAASHWTTYPVTRFSSAVDRVNALPVTTSSCKPHFVIFDVSVQRAVMRSREGLDLLARHLAVLELQPADVLLVGDSVDAAADAGAACVLYDGGYHDRSALYAVGVPVVGSLVRALADPLVDHDSARAPR